jgi:hypothetical protein
MRVVEDEIENDLYDVEKLILFAVPFTFFCVSYLSFRYVTRRGASSEQPGDGNSHPHKE